MSDKSAIEWTDSTWNPVRGCTKVSPGCKHCYAERFAERFRGVPGHPFEQGFDVRLVPEALELPLRWRKPRRIFVNSMSDLFHEDVPDSFVLQVFDVIRRCHTERPGHLFQLLTKRSARMRDFCARLRWDGDGEGRLWLSGALATPSGFAPPGDGLGLARALTNLWLGVSCEDQRAADERIPHLIATPAAVRFLSCEPLLGPVDLSRWIRMRSGCDGREGPHFAPGHVPDGTPCPECGGRNYVTTWGDDQEEGLRSGERYAATTPLAEGAPLHWVIVGGESGPGARPCDVAWIRSLVEQCRAAQVPAFVKQLGAHVIDRNDAGFDGDEADAWPAGTDVEHDEAGTDYQGAPVRVRLRDRKGGDMAEWPADLRVRQMPSTETEG